MVCGDGPLKITLIGTRVKVVYCGYLHLLCSHHILLLIGSVWQMVALPPRDRKISISALMQNIAASVNKP